MRSPRALALAAVLAGLVTPAVAVELPYRAVNRHIVETQIVPKYQTLATTTAALETQGSAFCAAPDAIGLDKLRRDFHDSMDAWMAIQHVRFGPIETLMRGFRLQFWPDKNNALGKQLGKLLTERDVAALAPERFQRTSAAVQGLPALERLLFDKEADSVLLEESDERTFRCQLLQAVTGNLASIATDLLRDWRDGETAFSKTIDQAGPDNAYFLDHREVSAKLLDGPAFVLQAVTDQKLTRPLGKSLDRAKPKRAESWRSGRSLRNIRLNIEAAAAVYDGLSALLPDNDDAGALKRRIDAEFAMAKKQLDAIPVTLRDAVTTTDGRAGIESLMQTLAGLSKVLQGPFAQATDLRVGFNALDGD